MGTVSTWTTCELEAAAEWGTVSTWTTCDLEAVETVRAVGDAFNLGKPEPSFPARNLPA